LPVEVFTFAQRQDTNRVGRVDEDVVDEVGGHSEAIKHKNLDIGQDVRAAQVGEDTA